MLELQSWIWLANNKQSDSGCSNHRFTGIGSERRDQEDGSQMPTNATSVALGDCWDVALTLQRPKKLKNVHGVLIATADSKSEKWRFSSTSGSLIPSWYGEIKLREKKHFHWAISSIRFFRGSNRKRKAIIRIRDPNGQQRKVRWVSYCHSGVSGNKSVTFIYHDYCFMT